MAEALKITLARIADGTIRAIELGGCNLGDGGAKTVADSLLAATKKANSGKKNEEKKNNSNNNSKISGNSNNCNNAINAVDFSWNALTVKGVQCLVDVIKNMPAITSLDLRDNMFQSEAVKPIADLIASNENKGLLSVYLGWNDIDAKGAKVLADALAVNKSITSIHLGDNKIGDEGAKAIAYALTKNNSITFIDLANNSITDQGATAIAASIAAGKSLRAIDLSVNSICTEGFAAIVASLYGNCALARVNMENNRDEVVDFASVAAQMKDIWTILSFRITTPDIFSASTLQIRYICHRNTQVRKQILPLLSCLSKDSSAVSSSSTKKVPPFNDVCFEENYLFDMNVLRLVIQFAV